MLISRSRGTCLISCVSRDALPSWWILVVISVSGRHRLAPSRSAISYFSDYLQWKDVIHGFGAIAIKRRCSNPIKLVTPYASWRQSDELDTWLRWLTTDLNEFVLCYIYRWLKWTNSRALLTIFYKLIFQLFLLKGISKYRVLCCRL